MRYKSRISYLLEFFHSYLVLLALMTIPIGVQTYTSSIILLGKTVFVLVAIVVLFFADRHCRSIFSFLSICVPLLVLPYFLRTNGIDFTYQMAAILLLIVTYFICRLSTSTPWTQEPNIYFEGLFLVIYFIGIYLKNDWIKNCMVYFTIAYLLLMLLYTNITNMGNFFKLNREITNLPAKQILLVNRMVLLILSIVTIAAMILVPVSGLGNVITGIGNGLFQLIKWIIRLFQSPGDGNAPPATPMDIPKHASLDAFNETNSEGMKWFFEILTTIALWAGTIALLAGIIYAIYYVIQHFYRPNTDSDEKLFLKNILIKETYSSLPKTSLTKTEKLGRDPNGIVRKIYKKTILKHAAKTPPKSFTPTQIEEFSELAETKEREMLHYLYEKARYSEHGVTKEEATSLKNSHIS